MTDDVLEMFRLFLLSDKRSEWLNGEIMKIYVRKSRRFLKDKMYDCIDLAVVEIIEENDRGKGFFTDFLKKFLKLYSNKNIFVESIVNPKLESILNSFGFEKKENELQQVDMFLIQE